MRVFKRYTDTSFITCFNVPLSHFVLLLLSLGYHITTPSPSPHFFFLNKVTRKIVIAMIKAGDEQENEENTQRDRPRDRMSYYGLLPLEVDVLGGAEVVRDGQTVEVGADLAVVHRGDVEEEHQTDEEKAGG